MIEGFNDDLNRLTADLTGASLRLQVKAARGLSKIAHDIEATAKQLVPVDTGATKNSIGIDHPTSQDLVVEIGPTTEYAPYLELGTVYMAPHAFMGPALDRHNPAFYGMAETLSAEVIE